MPTLIEENLELDSAQEITTAWYGLPDLSTQLKHNFGHLLNQPILLKPKEEDKIMKTNEGKFAWTAGQAGELCLILDKTGEDEYFLMLIKPASYGTSYHPSKSELVGKYHVVPGDFDPDKGILFQGTLQYTPLEKTVVSDKEMEFHLKDEFADGLPEGVDEDYDMEEHNIKQSSYAQEYLLQLADILENWEVTRWY